MPVEGVDKLLRAFTAHTLKLRKSVGAEVGYKAPHAIHVHENVEMKWKGRPRPKGHHGVYWGRPYSPGSSKFLEKASRRLRGQTTRTIYRMLRAGRSLADAVRQAATDILALSNTLVPIDFGDLLLSGYVKVE